ncbi:hypothetical protein [Pseudomonas sp. MWU13-2517]|nr:hypothetical protein [Pseudomonas sp. MWU13-2517]
MISTEKLCAWISISNPLLNSNHGGLPIGERIIVVGRVCADAPLST